MWQYWHHFTAPSEKTMTSATDSKLPTSSVHWPQVACLAAVQGAITLSWIAYGLYLPRFIEQVFAYPPAQAQQFAAFLLVVESAIAVAIEPLFGSLSDRWQQWYGSKMPLVMAGAIASILVFMALPVSVAFGGNNESMHILLPGMAVFWAVAMATFRSPVLSLLGRFAKSSQLPLAASMLTLVGGCIGSIKPLASDTIVAMGAPAAFAIASVTLLVGVGSLRWAVAVMPAKPANKDPKKEDSEKEKPLTGQQTLVNLAIVMLTGAMIGLGMRLLTGEVVPRMLKAHIVGMTGVPLPTLLGCVLIIQGVFAIGTGASSKWIDNKRLMMLAFGGIVLCLGALFMPQEAIVALLIIVFLLICISAVNNGMVAFALGMVPKSISGLSVGLFFGGLSGAIAIFGYLVPKPAELVLLHVLGLAALACICASGTIASGKYLRKLQS